MERKTYNFSNGINAYQEELTLEQDYLLAGLITGLNPDNMDDLSLMQVKDVLNILVKENIIEKFLRIVLITPLADTQKPEGAYKSLRNSEVKQIIEDFFTLNPLLSRALQILKSAPDTQTTSPRSSSSETTAENMTPGS